MEPTAAVDTVIVFTGGDLPPDAELAVLSSSLPDASWVIAADSGLGVARRLGRRVDEVVGDLDSVEPRDLEAAAAAGARVERHPEAKDATDLELALGLALARGPDEIVVVGGAGGRLDHFLGGALLLASPAYAGARLQAFMGGGRLHVVRDTVTVTGRRGQLVSLVAVHGPAEGVRTEGLLYPLRGETLPPGSTRGVSNELLDAAATITVEAGVLLVVLPGEQGTHVDRGLAPD